MTGRREIHHIERTIRAKAEWRQGVTYKPPEWAGTRPRTRYNRWVYRYLYDKRAHHMEWLHPSTHTFVGGVKRAHGVMQRMHTYCTPQRDECRARAVCLLCAAVRIVPPSS
jgi:hypothetical protein